MSHIFPVKGQIVTISGSVAHRVCHIFLSFFKQHFKNIKSILECHAQDLWLPSFINPYPKQLIFK